MIACDGTYTHRNNNANEATETFVEQATPWSFAVHQETIKCSENLQPQAAESVLVPNGLMFLRGQGMKISLLVHDGKRFANPNVAEPQAEDPWHVGRVMQSDYIK